MKQGKKGAPPPAKKVDEIKYNKKAFAHSNFLFQAGSILAAKNPNLSRHLTITALDVASKNVIRLTPKLKQTFCRGCGTQIVPSVNSTVTLVNESLQKTCCSLCGRQRFTKDIDLNDPNARILPCCKKQRLRLLPSVSQRTESSDVKPIKKKQRGKRLARKIAQLQKKAESAKSLEKSVAALKALHLPPEVSKRLQSSTKLTHKVRKRKRDSESAESGAKDESVKNFSEDGESTAGSELSPVRKKEESPLLVVNIESRETSAAVSDEKLVLAKKDAEPLLAEEETEHYKFPFVKINRLIEVEKRRLAFPSALVEQEIVDLVKHHDVSIITGATGCGKSTQVPQYLLEGGLANSTYKIGVTQPRRVAVRAIYSRVCEEVNNSSLIGFQVRHDKSVNIKECLVKFMTDGILLRELQNDFLMKNYSVIILDEAHERSVNCDILIGLLSRVVQLRRKYFNSTSQEERLPPLKLVIMSATLRIEDFSQNQRLFKLPPPSINIEAPTHPVIVHFSRRTNPDYIKEATRKTLQIHRRLPPGSVLVFVTGRSEVLRLCKKLNSLTDGEDSDASVEGLQIQDSSCDEGSVSAGEEHPESVTHDPPNISHEQESAPPETISEQDEIFNLSSDNEEGGSDHEVIPKPQLTADEQHAINLGFDSAPENGSFNHPKVDMKPAVNWLGGGVGMRSQNKPELKAVPLYALLSSSEQRRAFGLPNKNERIVVVSTNVAETSLTLPNIRYVVDCGREKRRHYISELSSKGLGLSSSLFKVQFISKASADQRSGRAGRVGPGHCYRLYSTAVYTDVFPEFPIVNLFLTPLDSVFLFMASLGIDKIDTFPFPTPPPQQALQQACSILTNLGALTTKGYKVTPLGRLMAKIPVAPRFAKVLIAALSRASKAPGRELINAAAAIIAVWTLNAAERQVAVPQGEQGKRKTAGRPVFDSDLEVALWSLARFMRAEDKRQFCERANTNERSLLEATELYQQLVAVISKEFLEGSGSSHAPPLPTLKLSRALHDVFLEGMADLVAVRSDMMPSVATPTKAAYVTGDWQSKVSRGLSPFVYISNDSALHSLKPRPAFVAFGDLAIKQERRVMGNCFAVSATILAKLRSPLIAREKWLNAPAPHYCPKLKTEVAFVSPEYLPLHVQLPTIKWPLKDKPQNTPNTESKRDILQQRKSSQNLGRRLFR